MTTELATRQQRRTPEGINSQLRLQASSRNVALTSGRRLVGKYDESGALIGSEIVLTGCTATGSAEEREAMAREIEAKLSPAPQRDVENWLVELDAIAPSRASDELTGAVKLAAYTKRLSGYPADIVEHALLGQTWRFFPSWHELKEIIDPVHQDRLNMLYACTRAPREPIRRDHSAEPRITAERADEIMAEVGYRPKRFGGSDE